MGLIQLNCMGSTQDEKIKLTKKAVKFKLLDSNRQF